MLRPRSVLVVSTVVLLLAACGSSHVPDEDYGLALPDRVDPDDGATGTDAELPDGAAPDTSMADGGGDTSAPAGLRVFVSSTASKGNLGGFAGADAACKTLATAAGLSGNWAAWLSGNNGGPNAVDRVTSAGPWRLVSGELVASTKAELVSGALRHAIDHDEKGVALAAPSGVWTGTGPNGQFLTNDCDKWTTGNNGRGGVTNAVDGNWTSNTVVGCGAVFRFYCFQL